MQGLATNVDVDALGKKSNLSSKCKLMERLKKCPQESPIASRCYTIEWKGRLINIKMQLNGISKRFINRKDNIRWMKFNALHIHVISINGPQQFNKDIVVQDGVIKGEGWQRP